MRWASLAVMAVAIAAGLLLLALGAWRLDDAFRAERFRLPERQCPLGVWRDVATPLCAPTRGW